MIESIATRKWNIENARRDKMKELMAEYDKTVYYPMKKSLVRECFLNGHVRGKFHTNGLGWSWFYCGACGGRCEIVGPEGEMSKDDGDWNE